MTATTRLRRLACATIFAFVCASGAAFGANSIGKGPCLPGINALLNGPDRQVYEELFDILSQSAFALQTELDMVVNQTTYQSLLAFANSTANSIPTGRLVITLPDGTVVIDTAKDDGLGAGQNSFANFQSKTINENHNTRNAIMSAQQYPCGIGAETKVSTSTGQNEIYAAVRLGEHLSSSGTARLSVVQ